MEPRNKGFKGDEKNFHELHEKSELKKQWF